MAIRSELLHDAGMAESQMSLTNEEVRRRRLAQLIGLVDGGLDGISAKAKVSARNLDHFLKRRKQSTVRADGSQPVVGLGDKVARQIEEAFSLGAGWLDWPFEGVDFAAYNALDGVQRAIVQGRMIAALEEAAKHQPKVLAPLRRKSVSNEKVEEAFGKLRPDVIKAAHEKAHTRRASKTEVELDSEPDLFRPDRKR